MPLDLTNATEEQKRDYVRRALNGLVTTEELWGMRSSIGSEYVIYSDISPDQFEGPTWREVLSRLILEVAFKANELGATGSRLSSVTFTGAAEFGNLTVGLNVTREEIKCQRES